MTPNEKRAQFDLPPVNGGDELLVPVDMIPLDQVGFQQENLPDQKQYIQNMIDKGIDKEKAEKFAKLIYDQKC